VTAENPLLEESDFRYLNNQEMRRSADAPPRQDGVRLM
jgi:hypothetical protein